MSGESNSVKEVSHDNGPHSVGEAWVHSINPIDLFKDANQSSKSIMPGGIGFAFEHPSVLASPEFLEIAALDPLFRVSKAAWDTGIMTPVHMLQDTGSAAKDVVNVAKDVIDLPIDLLTLHPGAAIDDVKNTFVDGYHALRHAVDAAVVDPIKGVWKGITDIF